MIKINRATCPKELAKSRKAKAEYRKKAVVKTLWEMQHGKCCYCEQTIPSKGHLKAVEHFRPKAVFTGRTNDWNNLLLACAQCNGEKSDKFPVELTSESKEVKVIYLKSYKGGRPLIIDPSNPSIDPEDHLDFDVTIESVYGLIKPKNNSRLGRETIGAIGLDENFYTMEHRKIVRMLLERLIVMADAADRSEAERVENSKERFEGWMSSKSEFAALARAFARHHKLDNKFGIGIPAG